MCRSRYMLVSAPSAKVCIDFLFHPRKRTFVKPHKRFMNQMGYSHIARTQSRLRLTASVPGVRFPFLLASYLTPLSSHCC